MNLSNHERERWVIVVLYAVAMAWVESATVYYLRTLVGRIDPYQPNPLPDHRGLGEAELIREAATLVMLGAIGWLAGSSWRSRFAYSLIAFGVWDIFYYAFLKLMTGWPHSLFDWDVLFLLPLPWWGPVIAPMLIATLMICFGTLVSQGERPGHFLWPGWRMSSLSVAGIFVALLAFMADAIRSSRDGIDALRATLPTSFNWPLFLAALALMCVSIFDVVSQLWRRRL